jgi:hypothetical protein
MQSNSQTPQQRPRSNKNLVRREAKKEAREEVRRLAKQKAKNMGFNYRGGSSLKPRRRKLHISEYLASLLTPETMNVPAPSLGPYPTREFSLKSVWEIKLNTAAAVSDAVCFDVDPGQLYPIDYGVGSAGTLIMHYGNTNSQESSHLLGTGAPGATDSSGPAWLSELRQRAGNAFLNSASLKVDYVGGTFKDAGLLCYATVPVLDRNSSAAAPPLDTSIATWPLAGSVPTPQGIHLFWLPGEYGRADRVLLCDYTWSGGQGLDDSTSAIVKGISGENVGSYWRVFATTGVDNGDSVFRVTLTQNFSFITSDKLFASSPSTKVGWSSPLQQVVEKRALAQAVHSNSANSIIGVPTSRLGRDKEPVEDPRFQKQRTASLSKFLKKEWDRVSPYLGKLLWDNKGAIGNYISDLVTPASPAGWSSEVIAIEEVAEEAAEALPLLAL